MPAMSALSRCYAGGAGRRSKTGRFHVGRRTTQRQGGPGGRAVRRTGWLHSRFRTQRCRHRTGRHFRHQCGQAHFKHEMPGKRRLHKRDNGRWVDQVALALEPDFATLDLASPPRSLTGKTVTIARMRRTPVELADGTKLVVTIHPSALLRIEDEGDKHAAYHALVDDLKAARAAAGKAPAKR